MALQFGWFNVNKMTQHSKVPLQTRAEKPTVYARRLSHLIFQRPDLQRAVRFLTDFGLTVLEWRGNEVFLRGTSQAPYCYHLKQGAQAAFIGFGLEVDSLEDLHALAALQPSSGVVSLATPGGGSGVSLQDPSGFLVQVVCGQQYESALPHRQALPLNYDAQATRVNDTQRSPLLPPEVLRLGHVVLEVADFHKTMAWYVQHFGMIASDIQVLPDGSPAVAFMRLNLGDTPADHHTLALAQGIFPTYSHSAYELVDADAVGMGQRVLREKGWQHAWGIGRHVLGSQIFDYWQDPWGSKHEHYCDGDLFDASVATGFHPVSRKAMAQWGPVMPKSFTRPELGLQQLKQAAHSLRHSQDVTLKKVITLAKIFM